MAAPWQRLTGANPTERHDDVARSLEHLAANDFLEVERDTRGWTVRFGPRLRGMASGLTLRPASLNIQSGVEIRLPRPKEQPKKSNLTGRRPSSVVSRVGSSGSHEPSAALAYTAWTRANTEGARALPIRHDRRSRDGRIHR